MPLNPTQQRPPLRPISDSGPPPQGATAGWQVALGKRLAEADGALTSFTFASACPADERVVDAFARLHGLADATRSQGPPPPPSASVCPWWTPSNPPTSLPSAGWTSMASTAHFLHSFV